MLTVRKFLLQFFSEQTYGNRRNRNRRKCMKNRVKNRHKHCGKGKGIEKIFY